MIKNLYGLKDAGKTWYDYLKLGLDKRGWKQSQVDSCMFTKDGIILLVYVDDAILISPYKSLIQKKIKSLQENYNLTDHVELKDYLGVRFEQRKYKPIKLSQPKMIERVLQIVGIDPNNPQTHFKNLPASAKKVLDNNPDVLPRKQHWHYRSAVGCLSYIQAMNQPDITMPTQACARFFNEPKREHEEAVKRICQYLAKTKDDGLILKPDSTKGLECYVDTDWAGSYTHQSSHDLLTAHSQTGYMISYARFPIIWTSKMQPLIALSTTKAEYIVLSTALHEVIAVMNLIKELRSRHFKLNHPTPKISCRTFEDKKKLY